MNDQDERESTPTLAPDTDRGDRDTTPPDPAAEKDAARHLNTMLPAPVAPKLDAEGLVEKPGNMPELLYNQLMKVHQAQRERDRDLLDADGKLARMLQTVVDRIAGAPVRELTGKVDALARAIGKVKGEVDHLEGQVTEMRAQVTEMRAELTALRERADAQERDLKATNETLDELESRWNARSAEASAPAKPTEA